MPADDYNGWANRETWLVALWLDNDPETHHVARSLTLLTAEEVRAGYGGTGFAAAGEALAAYAADLAPDLGASLSADLLAHALARVEWADIAIAHAAEADDDDGDDACESETERSMREQRETARAFDRAEIYWSSL